MVDERARVGFTQAVEEYDRGRPEYPTDALAHLTSVLELRSGRTVLDLGAGTGKLTRLLVATGAKILAVEPLSAMRAKIALPGVDLYEGTAEQIPLANASVDAVTVAQAFHWFDAPRAVVEIARVLRPQGGLALIWNVRDERVPWVAELTKLLEPYEGDTPRHRHRKWEAAFDGVLFEPLQTKRFSLMHRAPPAAVVDRMASISFIGALPHDERARFLDRVRALLATHPDVAGRELIDVPYETDVYWTKARHR